MNHSPYTDFVGQYINGQSCRGGSARTLLVNNPYTGETIAELCLASLDDLERACQTANAAHASWARTLPTDRSAVFLRAAQIMQNRREEIINWIIRESGSTRMKASMEWDAVRNGMLEAATLPSRMAGRIMPVDIVDKESRVYRKPLGIIGVISPWNWPMHLSHRSVAPALALGNAVVLKPSQETPISGGLLLARIYEEAGLPAGLLNVLVGNNNEIGDAFVQHPKLRFISFTGSNNVGRHINTQISSGSTLKHVALELGGNAPIVVLDDADLEQAVHAAVVGRFLHQGQICMSANRIIVDGSLYHDFIQLFVERVSRLKFGNPEEEDTVIGPLINNRQLEGAVAHIARARADGLPLLLGGSPQGLVLPPHVFAPVSNDSALAQTELFSPIAPVIRADNEHHALQMANATEYGLSGSVFTRDEGRGLRFAQQLEAGMVHINDIPANDCPNSMFGGVKNSGLGRFNGDWIIEAFTTDYWISVQHAPRPYPF
ncbi:aldehyde dehydrogenase family protein [Enterobacter genomosp. O]|uniref:Aldehyde dehydrogenase n=1 Tax=Enterobacter genomosp. O TaxID=2364150 RepID=A0A0X4ESZ1_9ENTR|nr:aldehyde dehydrogenase family protein [Enterobacter genomosp. O]KUQ84825.1 aldehyde dehydrogenase [Enterobacter genomosp. O]